MSSDQNPTRPSNSLEIHRFHTERDSLEDIVSTLRPPILERYASKAKTVDEIVARVRDHGDPALVEYIRAFDCPSIDVQALEVTEAEFDAAMASVEPQAIQDLRYACERVERYHRHQLAQTWMEESEGVVLGQMYTPVARVGIYVPGGLPLPSTVYMAAIPARVAGVGEIFVATPPDREGRVHPLTLAACREVGVERVFKMGGAHAIAALAFGTQSVPNVDKIVGPGNIYVLLAKRAVFGYVGIESLPGPTDVFIVADESARAGWVAADLLAQAEHGANSSAIVASPSGQLIQEVERELVRQVGELPRSTEAYQALRERGALIVTRTLEEAIEVANAIAPEHLELLVEGDAAQWLPKIRNAGAIFLGHFTPEALGDYVAGPSHILPTEGTSRFFSPLTVDDFLKKSSVIGYAAEALARDGSTATRLARSERLEGHARSVEARFQVVP